MAGPVLLAAYGTLMTGQRNGLDAAIRARMQGGRPCLIRGRLYEVRDIGPDGAHTAYPALVEDAGDAAMVQDAGDAAMVPGELLAVGADADAAAIVLAAIDRYEDCRPGDPNASTYLRRQRPVLADGGILQAWVYLYNRPTHGLRPIETNRWA